MCISLFPLWKSSLAFLNLVPNFAIVIIVTACIFTVSQKNIIESFSYTHLIFFTFYSHIYLFFLFNQRNNNTSASQTSAFLMIYTN